MGILKTMKSLDSRDFQLPLQTLPGINTHSMPEWKNTRYAEYVRRSSVIASRISGGARHNMAGAGPRTHRRTRRSRCMSLAMVAQKT